MPRVAIVNDLPEVVAMVASVLTQGDRQFLKQIGATEYTVERLRAFDPGVVVLALHRRVGSLDRPIRAFDADVAGAHILGLLGEEPDLRTRPLILLGFSVRRSDVPPELLAPFATLRFLVLPEELQELNPLLSSYLGPAR